MTLHSYQDSYNQNSEISYIYAHNLDSIYDSFTEGDHIFRKLTKAIYHEILEINIIILIVAGVLFILCLIVITLPFRIYKDKCERILTIVSRMREVEAMNENRMCKIASSLLRADNENYL